jgi:hypothetical protein
MSGHPLPLRVTQSELDVALGALRDLSVIAQERRSAALLIESNVAIGALLEAAEFDGVTE